MVSQVSKINTSSRLNKIMRHLYFRIMVSLLEVVYLLETGEEAETLMEEEETPMEDEEIFDAQINGVASSRRILMMRKIDGTKLSHNVIIPKGSGICKNIFLLQIDMYHLQKQKIVKLTWFLLVIKQLKSIKM